MGNFARIEAGVVIETLEFDGDIKSAFHPDMIWVDVSDVEGIGQGWLAKEEAGAWSFKAYVKPEPTHAEVAGDVLRERDSLLSSAALRVAPLQDAVDRGVADDEEVVLLDAWKDYRIALSRIEKQAKYPFEVEWPESPQ